MCRLCRCGPCKIMAPKYEQLSGKYNDVVFLKLDCNQENRVSNNFLSLRFGLCASESDLICLFILRQPLAKELGIKVVPTFKILKDSKIVKEVTGAKFDDLVFAIETARSG